MRPATLLLGAVSLGAADFSISSFAPGGLLTWSHAPVPGVVTVESAAGAGGPWFPSRNAFATTSEGQAQLADGGESRYYRLSAATVSPTPQGFTNLIRSYGLLETIAGNGAGQSDGVSYWQTWFEGWPGSWASLSRPHFAMADRAGNVYIADKNSHALLRVTPEGTIFTHAGTHEPGFDGEGPAPATSLRLSLPNSLWVRSDGVVYVLDTGNGRVRRVDSAGTMATLFLATPDGSALSGGRGLWVRDDESLAYFCAGTRVRYWTPAGGVKTLASGFTELGDLFVEEEGSVLVCDRGAHYVYRVTPGGYKSVLAGNGTAAGGGDGAGALVTGLHGPRGIWPLPTGGYLILTHDGCQLWYLDAAGILHLLMNGAGGRTHEGDGSHFYSPEPRISEGRSVTVDYDGHILICESDYGYVRRIRFERMPSGLP